MADVYVVVTIATNGIVHAWGDDESQPYESESEARTRVRELKRTHRELYPGVGFGSYKICKVLGRPPMQLENGEL